MEGVENGGWDYYFLDDIDEDLLCVICLLPMRNPHQVSTCGHLMCHTCLENVLCRNPICPKDRKPIERNTVFPDLRCERQIMALKVKCQFSDIGCNWNGELVDLIKRHLNDCEQEAIPCTRKDCTHTPSRKEFKNHLENECSWRIVQCEYCKKDVIFYEMAEHLKNDCQEISIPCKNHCGNVTQREKVEAHLEICPNRLIRCHYFEVGCNQEIMAKDMESHMVSNVRQHMDWLFVAFIDEKREIKMLKEENSRLKENYEKDHTQIKILKEADNKLEENFKKDNTQINMLKDENNKLRKNLKEIRKENDKLKANLKEIREENNTLEEDLEEIRRELSSTASITNTSTIIQLYKENFDLDPGYLEYIWPIINFQTEYEKSKEDRNYIMYSPRYLTGPKGYHFRLMAYHEIEKENSCLAIFAQIMQGTHDDSLPWPCKSTIEISILNCNKYRNVIWMLEYFKKSKCKYTKPVEMFGHSFGSSDPITETQLSYHGYILNDTLFVKFSIKI